MPPKNNYQYTDYTPDISSLNELPDSEELKDTAKPQPKRSQARRARAQKKDAAKKPAAQKQVQGPSFGARLREALTGTSARMLFGIFIGCIGIYMLVAFVSYFVHCVQDQSVINNVPIGHAGKVGNAGGEGGARIAEFLINECFGLGSLVIVVWLLAICLKLLVGRPKFKTLDFTIKCVIALITASLIVGLLTIGFHSTVNWGGYHGRYVNEFIVSFIGWSGAVLLSIFMLSVFVVICLRDLVKWIMKKRRAYVERRRKAAEERAEREAKEAEIRRMQQQEEIDDFKAGETATLNAAPLQDISDDDTKVDFSGEDAPLYSMESTDSGIDTVRQTEVPDFPADNNDESTDEAATYDNPEIFDNSNPDAVTETKSPDAGDKPADALGDSESDSSSDGEKTSQADKMVVNVNSIGQSQEKRFKSEVELYESFNYKFPPFDLLKEGEVRVSVDEDEQLHNQEKIEKTLLNFGIPIIRIEATVGPTVTLYEIVPDKGVKIAKIRSLVDDIALSLAAKGVRIIAPIPGKGTVGIEVANKDPQTVSMRTVIKSRKYQESKYKLPIALGSTISNDVYIADLAKMPHLLVAGATGQGKSVGLNAIIASLMYCKAPWQLKFVLIDPKQVEFSIYNKIKDHYMAMIPGDPDDEAVITDMDKVEATLNSLVVEMENRYSLLKSAHTRNVEEYNAKLRDGLLNPADGHKYLPYIVVVVDEFGDLVMVKGKAVEMPIARLAQKARAVGMHVIIATQRPSVNVITGIIKANFPARISFKVSQAVDSKTILDAPGAQQLIGRGDMLIFNNSEMVRVQCAFIDTPEVEAICDYVARQPYPQGPYQLPEPPLAGADESAATDMQFEKRDPLFAEVARMVVSKNQASTSSIQRIFSLGYNRAGRIMDQLEQAHIVGPSQGGKPRTVLVDMIELDRILTE